MNRCRACHRPLLIPSADGLGPVCRKTRAPAPVTGCDLFGYDIEKAAREALERLQWYIDFAAWEAHFEIRRAFAHARHVAGVRLTGVTL